MPDQNSWIGSKGFDEARYYRDEKHEIGIEIPDEQIKTHCTEAISRNENLRNFDIDVKVIDGQVTLIGEVDGSSDREEAERTIRHLSGVKSIINLLSLY